MTSQVSPQDSLVSEAERTQFVEQGFLVKEGLVSGAELDDLKADVLAFARGRYECESLQAVPEAWTDDEALSRILCIHQPHYLSPTIRHFTQHPLICQVLSQVVAAHLPSSWWDGSVKCMQSMYFLKAPGMPGQAWHQDEIYIPTRDRSLCGAWIAVDDATIDNGCLWVLPGSHRNGVLYEQRAHEQNGEFDFAPESHGFDDSEEIPVEVPAGSVVFFNGYLLHRSKKNVSERYRRALVSHYCSAQTLLPWYHVEAEGESVARMDKRNVHLVTGNDPYAYKGYEEPGQNVWLRHFEGMDDSLKRKPLTLNKEEDS